MSQVEIPGNGDFEITFGMQAVYLVVPLGSIFGKGEEWKQKWAKWKVKLQWLPKKSLAQCQGDLWSYNGPLVVLSQTKVIRLLYCILYDYILSIIGMDHLGEGMTLGKMAVYNWDHFRRGAHRWMSADSTPNTFFLKGDGGCVWQLPLQFNSVYICYMITLSISSWHYIFGSLPTMAMIFV